MYNTNAKPSYLNCLLVLLAFCGGCAREQSVASRSQGHGIVRRMETYVGNFMSTSITDLDPANLIADVPLTRRVHTDSAYLRKIDGRLAQFPNCTPPVYDGIDVRLTCLLYRESEMPDTLAFDSGTMYYRGILCKADTTLLRMIIDSVNDHARRNYDWYVNEMKEVRKRSEGEQK
jgi:hypothetical protein